MPDALNSLAMAPSPQTLPALAAMAFLFGMRHGFDADHLATVDGLSRYNLQQRPRLARWCGVLFSLGHGAVVIVFALAVSLRPAQWQAPDWLSPFGDALSVLFLLLLSLANLLALVRADATETVALVGLRGRWLSRLLAPFGRRAQVGSILAVGALFALSFDTLSQAALFAYTAGHHGGWQAALTLGLVFTLGMLLTDGLNGWFIAGLIGRADALARVASRCMSLAVSLLSLGIAALIAAPYLLPMAAEWLSRHDAVLNLLPLLALPLAYLLARRLARSPVATAASS